MSINQAIYNVERPSTFDDIYGHDKIINILKKIVNKHFSGKPVHHGYIFAGMYGSGKTSCARILARAFNCLDIKNGNPCNSCDPCKEHLENRSNNIIEIDAASHSNVEGMRALRQEAMYSPINVGCRVYIIDEAHMVTQQGSNTILKIVEEPPAKTKFIFVTTNINSILDTLLSRLFIYQFDRVSFEESKKYIINLLEKENIQYDDSAISLIARNSEGSVRNILTSLEQVLIIEDYKRISYKTCEDIFGIINITTIRELTKAIFRGDINYLDKEFSTFKASGCNIEQMWSLLVDDICSKSIDYNRQGVLNYRYIQESIHNINTHMTHFFKRSYYTQWALVESLLFELTLMIRSKITNMPLDFNAEEKIDNNSTVVDAFLTLFKAKKDNIYTAWINDIKSINKFDILNCARDLFALITSHNIDGCNKFTMKILNSKRENKNSINIVIEYNSVNKFINPVEDMQYVCNILKDNINRRIKNDKVILNKLFVNNFTMSNDYEICKNLSNNEIKDIFNTELYQKLLKKLV